MCIHQMGSARTISKDKSNAKIYDQIHIRIRKDGKDGITATKIREAAIDYEESINSFILNAIKERAAKLHK